MDHALTLPAGFDRRHLIRLLLAGATGAVLAEAGIPVTGTGPVEGPRIEIESLHRTVHGLTALYDSAGPAKVTAAVKAGQTRLLNLMGGTLTPAQQREVTVLTGRFLALGAWADIGAGRYAAAERGARLAARTATHAGDGATAGHALAMESGAMGGSGREHHALIAAHRAHAAAQTGPSVVQASLAEAQAAARLPRVDRVAVLDAVRRAEAEHATLPPEKWGSPGCGLGTWHPAALAVYGADALICVGLFGEARARMQNAATLLGEQDGLQRAYLWLQEARVSVGYGDLDEAYDFAQLAVASAEARPVAWIGGTIGRMNDASKDTYPRGYFTDLIERTKQWRYDDA